MKDSNRCIYTDPCPEKWDAMKELGSNTRNCANCKVDVEDLSHLSLETIVSDHWEANKCVRLTHDQIDYFSFYKSIKKTIVFSSLFLSTSFINVAQAQDHKDSCLIVGTLVYRKKIPASDIPIYITIDGQTYETKSGEDGYFMIVLPKNCRIQHSNIDALNKKRIRNQKSIDMKTIQTPFRYISVGSF